MLCYFLMRNLSIISDMERHIYLKRVRYMDNNLDSEFQYQLTMSLVRQLRRNGTISESEYKRIEAIMLKKYKPILGTLLSGNSLNDM